MSRGFGIAELYRRAVTDESLPVQGDDMEGALDWYFGRAAMADLLGRMGYGPAVPDVREAMLHDDSNQMREAAVRSLAALAGRRCVPDVIEVLKGDPSLGVRYEAAEALGDLGDPRALHPLRDMFEGDVVDLRSYAKNGCQGTLPRSFEGLTKVLTAMLMIGGELAERSLREAASDGDMHVMYVAKRSVQMKRGKVAHKETREKEAGWARMPV
jgi:HEAT repeat protein